MTPSRVAIRAMIRAELGELAATFGAAYVEAAVGVCVVNRLTPPDVARYARRLALRSAYVAWRMRRRECEALADRAAV